jgi:hypothetical protein
LLGLAYQIAFSEMHHFHASSGNILPIIRYTLLAYLASVASELRLQLRPLPFSTPPDQNNNLPKSSSRVQERHADKQSFYQTSHGVCQVAIGPPVSIRAFLACVGLP